MNENEMKKAFDAVEPENGAKERMYANVLKKAEAQKVVQFPESAPAEEKSAPKKHHSAPVWQRWGSLAACLALVAAIGLALPKLTQRAEPDDPPVMVGAPFEDVQSASDFEKLGFTIDAPANAENTILVPVAAQILTDKLPADAPAADYAAILQVLTDAGVNTVDVADTLSAHSGENIYYRTDHHWTSLGAYYAYCAWRGVQPNAEEWAKEVLCDNFRGTTWNKIPLPTVPAEEITAWYKQESRHVSYNDGQYETDSIYERKYLTGSDQYAVFLNSNQAQTVIAGSGKSGKLLLIKDSYGNTFSQFPVEDYAEVHVLDLRFFKGDVVQYARENGITDALVLYGTQNFVKDANIKGVA